MQGFCTLSALWRKQSMISRTIHSTNRNNAGKLLKGLVAVVTFLFFSVTHIHNSIHVVHSYYLHFLFSSLLVRSVGQSPWGAEPARALNSGLPYSRPAHYTSWATMHPYLCYAAPCRRIDAEKEAHTFLLFSYLLPIPLPPLSWYSDHGSPLPLSLFPLSVLQENG